MTEQRIAELRARVSRSRPLLPHEGLELLEEVNRCRDRINFLIESNNREVERRRAVENELSVEKFGNAPFVDEKGATWTRPTAWAYRAVCLALNDKTERLHQLLDGIAGVYEPK